MPGRNPTPFLARLETLVYQKGTFTIWRGTLLKGPLPPQRGVSFLGEDLLPGPEGFLEGQALVERHPRYGPSLRVQSARPLPLEALAEPGPGLPLEGLLEALKELGHTAPPLVHLAGLLGLSPEEVEALLLPLVASGRVQVAFGRAGLMESYRDEEAILRMVQRLAEPGPALIPPAGHGLTPEQAGIFGLFTRSRVAILTGGPGTGKSYTVSRLLSSPSLSSWKVALAAPTGKAAKRLAQLTGREAHTVHRLLGFLPQGGFRYGPHRPLPFHLVVVDEASMLDVPTALALLKAIGPKTLLLLVGDENQLPPVGPGSPFADLVGRVPTLALKTLHRQALDNPLVGNARRVLQGYEPTPVSGDDRFLLHLTDSAKLQEEALRYAEEVDVVLTATNHGRAGVAPLNTWIKGRRNPRVQARVGLALGVGPGDPVVFTRNDYALGLANGDTGEVLGLSPRGELLLDTGHEVVPIPQDAFPWVLPAYALTVHRSQGSEWPRVLIVLEDSQAHLLSRELLYTALTRAKERAILLATPKALERAREREASRRFTWLKVLG